MKVSTLATWSMVSLMTLFIFANWEDQTIYLLPYVEAGRIKLSIALAASAAMGYAVAHLVRVMNKDKGGEKKK